MMRLTSLTVSGFCGIAAELTIDLNASVVILAGRNGLGKTTVCDAIVWALTGVHPRGADPQNLYTSTPATVSLSGVADDGAWTITRIARSTADEVVLHQQGSSIQGVAAQAWLDRSLFPHQDASESVAALLSDSVYLQQETLRAFLSGRSDDERFAALARMVGARRLSQFVSDFDSERRQWSKAIKAREADVSAEGSMVQSLRSEVAAMEAELREAALTSDGASWDSWVTEVIRLTDAETPASISEKSIALLTSSLSRVQTKLLNDLSQLDIFGKELIVSQSRDQEEGHWRHRVDRARLRVDLANTAYERAEAAVVRAEAVAVEARAQVRAMEFQQRRMAQLAELALELLGSNCPVCEQDIDATAVATHLHRVLALEGDPETGATASLAVALNATSEAIGVRERCHAELQAARMELESTQQELQQEAVRQQARERILKELDLSQDADMEDQILKRRSEVQGLLDEVYGLRAASTEFTEQLQYEAMRKRLDASHLQLEELASDLEERQESLNRDLEAGRIATEIAKELKRASDDLVSLRLDEIQPLLDHLYAAVDPHPTFRSLRLATRVHYGHPRLDPIIADEGAGIEVKNPSLTLSTSQSNALAVVIFLAFSLGLSPSALDTLLLDDPLQNLDDIHLLGLVDVLRNVRSRRQLLVTTHDRAFARLLARKLRVSSPGDAVLVHDIGSWARSGPRIRTHRIPASNSPYIFS
jgi:DNA repair exonuclease SbcCD ATPase subunit